MPALTARPRPEVTTTQLPSTAPFCSRPLVRRLYQALVVALAVFLVTIVGFKQKFRGYLAEVRLLGPASEGLQFEEAVAWIKQVDRQVAAVANPPQAGLERAQIRVTRLADRASLAASHVEQLAQRWLYQYLPDRLQSYRQAALADLRVAATRARQHEDAASQELEILRQRQLAQIRYQVDQIATLASAYLPRDAGPPLADPAWHGFEHEKLTSLRRELSTLADQCTDEHPQVQVLRSQIAGLEQQLATAVDSRTRTSAQYVSTASTPVPALPRSAALTELSSPQQDLPPLEDLTAAVGKALAALSRATLARQEAEAQLVERMHELSTRASGIQWTKTAPIVSRLGGTPRWSTMLLAAFLSLVAGVVVFRASATTGGCSSAIDTTADLATVLELPILVGIKGFSGKPVRQPWKLLSARRLQSLVTSGEIILAVAVGGCLLSIAIEPALLSQVLADPFGALSETLGRFGL